MIVARENQSLSDIALMAGGTVECLFELADANGLSITDKIVPATELNTDSVATKRLDILDYYTRHNISPATINNEELFTGISFMIIGSTFKVG